MSPQPSSFPGQKNPPLKAALLYSSQHGKTRKVVAQVVKELWIAPEVFDVANGVDHATLAACDLLLFFTPTYGDEELHEDMENFLANFNVNLSTRCFVICELGNYYGYDFAFGAMPILRRRLLELNGTELCTPLSLDSLPKLNWAHLTRWIDHVNQALHERF